MEKRITHKDIELSGRKWRITKFDALTGSYVAYNVMTQVLPLLADMKDGVPDVATMTAALMASRKKISKEDFLELQKDCLAVCSELKSVGTVETPIQVFLSNGAWGVEGLDQDVPTVLGLTIHALVFNISSFFDGNVLGGAMGSFKDLNLSSAKE